jgi:hypothetical protein
VITVQEIQDQRTALSSSSVQGSVGFLSKIGHYYEQTRPSQIEHTFIFETEGLINDLYLKSLQEPSASKITEQLLEALSQVGSLAIAINNGPLDQILSKQQNN